MKRKLLKSVFIIATLASTIPIVNAAAPNYKFSAPTQQWKTTLSAPSGAVIGSYSEAYAQAAASDDRIYTVPGSTTTAVYPTISGTNDHYTQGYYFGDRTQNYWSGGNADAAMPYESITNATYYYLGPCIASDDAGTLWCSSRKTTYAPSTATWGVGARGLTYYTVRPGGNSSAKRTGLNLHSLNLHTSDRTDIMSVYGKGIGGTAHFWFAIGNTNTTECIIVEDQEPKRKLSFETPMINATNRTYVKQFATNRLIYNPGGTGTATHDIYLGTISGSLSDGTASVSWENTGLKVCRYGSTAFVLRGHGIIVYSSSPTTISLYDWTAQRDLGSFSPFSTASSNNYVSHSMDVKIVDDNTAALYVYVPGQGGAKYLITASEITDPVTNVSANPVNGTKNNITVSWELPAQGNPEKYAVSYSTDGGSSWSTEVETADLNYTYTNLADGTYTFKVIPYYDDTSTWGQAATTNSVTIVNYTNPVTNMQVQTGSGMPYSAIVNWNTPSGDDTPTKYEVSYSTNGGTSWSTAVETTNLTYTFSNLTQGEYTFKVTPYYGSTAGEASTKTATVYGVTTSVSTINVAYYNNTGNSITVSWTAPATDVAPEKYQVCYSTDGGASWSAAVETTDLTYTFNSLPIGTYSFKVTPVYNGVAGDAAISESINSLAPSGYTFTTSKRWEVRGTLGTAEAPSGKSIAVSNNIMYIGAPDKYATISYVNQGTASDSWPNFDTGFASYNWGYAMDNDDAGNIIITSGASLGYAATSATPSPIQFSVYPAGATASTNKKEIALTGDYIPGARFDFMAAQGNIYSGTGYIWCAPTGTSSVKRIKIENISGAPTPTEVATWTLPITTSTQVVVRPLDDGRLYFHNITGSCAIITLPEGGEEVTSNMIENLSISTTAKGNMNSDVFMLRGYTFHVKNDGAASSSIGIEINNLTATGNGDASYVPFNGLTPAGTNTTVSGISGYGSLVRAVNVDENTADVYCYSPNHGVTVYRVTASPAYTVTGAIKSLDYEYTTTATDEGTRQDVTLTWTAPKEATPTSYKVYCDGTLIATVASPALTYTDKNVNANHSYTVIPHFAGVAEDESLGLSVTTTEVKTVLFAPIITETRSYDGYSIVQIFFKMPSLSKVPSKYYSFNVYRDGVLLESGITQYNFIDDDLPKIEKEVEESHDYVYTIEAVYDNTYNNAKRMSDGKTVTVTYRDWALAGYLLQDVYNVPINPALGNMPTNFTNYEYYRQGHFYNGSWYIAERADALSKKDQDKANGIENSERSEIESDDENATGGVVVFGATNEIDVRRGMTGKVITNDAFESVGLAIDDKGTIFMRNNNLTSLAATAPNDGIPTQILAYPDGFTRRITEGALYKLTDGAYPTEPTAIIDLSALWTDDRFIDDMVFTSGKSNGQVAGRSDYYHMYGDVMSAEGGYLLLSPSWTRTIFKVKIVSGAYDSHEVMQFPESYTEENQYTGKTENHTITTGTENYGFRIAGRDAWMAQIRSQGYFGIHGVDADHAGEEHEHEWHAIFNTESRINNSGGTSVVAFDNPLTANVNDGETFLITPACMYSKNEGDFIVTRGIKEAIDEDVSISKLSPPMPVAQYKQTSQSYNITTNANGNWFHAETGTYESVSGEKEECVYIYQYVPGVRFAKYRLVPDNQLPAVYPTLNIATAYNSDQTDITHFNGVSTWNRPSGFGEANPENSRVWIDSYTYQLFDPNGKKIYETNVPEQYNADGTPVTSYSISTELMNEKTDSIAFNNYTARVAVNYQFATGSTQQSVFNLAIDNNDYIAQPAEDLGVWVYKKDAANENDNDFYRIELDFNKPSWDGYEDSDTEPVSYYTVKAVVNRGITNDTIDITGFALHNGSYISGGKIWADYEVTSQIPGTYDFDNSKAPYYTSVGDGSGLWNGAADGGSFQKVVLSWFHSVPAGTYDYGATVAAEGDELVITDSPDKWQYIIVAHYAAKNRYIAKEKPAFVSTAEGYTPTGVEVIGDNNQEALQIYPIPASTAITIKAGEAINSIVIYNEAGAEVMNANGNGETVTKVNIENLASGYYFVKVNNQAPVKIIKK